MIDHEDSRQSQLDGIDHGEDPLHAQWLDPLVAGANIGDCFVVNADGVENLRCHTPLEPHRVPA